MFAFLWTPWQKINNTCGVNILCSGVKISLLLITMWHVNFLGWAATWGKKNIHLAITRQLKTHGHPTAQKKMDTLAALVGLRLGGHVSPRVTAFAADFHILESYVTGSRAHATTVLLLQLYRTSLTVLIDDAELPLNYTNSDDTRLLLLLFLTIYFRKFIMSTNSYMNKIIF